MNVPDSWAKDYVDWCIKEGLLVGDDKGNLNLHGSIFEPILTIINKTAIIVDASGCSSAWWSATFGT